MESFGLPGPGYYPPQMRMVASPGISWELQQQQQQQQQMQLQQHLQQQQMIQQQQQQAPRWRPSAPAADARQPPKYFSIDVECVATGKGHNDRSVAQIALVDQYGRVWMNKYIQQTVPVVSYLAPLNGLSKELLEGPDSCTLPQAMAELLSFLPKNGVLVGQNIAADIKWLGLREGTDFESLIDLAGAFRVYNETYKSFTYFSLQHEARAILNIPMDVVHNAMNDAIVSIRLFNRYMELKDNPEEFKAAQQQLMSIPIDSSFAKKNPHFEEVCMGNKKTCNCSQPINY